MRLLDTVAAIIVAMLAAVAVGAQMVRWGRVLQREHYAPGAATRFFVRWARSSGRASVALLALPGVLVLLAVHLDPVAAGVAVAYGVVFPPRLSLRGRTSAVSWTRRLRVATGTALALVAAVVGVATALGRPWLGVAVAIVIVPVLVDAAAWIVRPLENTLAQRYVRQARARLDAVHPRVVAITGSFGKTSTKHHLAELLGGRRGVVPSPRSYNNRAGLSRAINESLVDGTTVFIAEMGTYGPGEIASLCDWCAPEISIITAIGPVHLERMKSLDVIERAKFEITERAATVILNVDDPRLATWVDRLRSAGKRVRTASGTGAADVVVATVSERWQLSIDGSVVALAPPVAGVRGSNLALAVAAALELGAPVDEIVSRLGHLTTVAHRMVVTTAPSGVMVIDDTFNANPAGARDALATLAALPINGRRVVVTPGLVELGPEQSGENEQLGRAVRALSAELVIVGGTNAAALRRGFPRDARRFAVRDDAVAWVRTTLGPGDGVLYLNDLPDHYP